MANTRITSFAAATNAVAGTTSTRLSKVAIQLSPSASAVNYIQLFDHASPTVGTTVPNHVIEIPIPANASGGYKQRHVEVYPGGGKRFATALSAAATTTQTGGTFATTNAPLALELYWEPGS